MRRYPYQGQVHIKWPLSTNDILNVSMLQWVDINIIVRAISWPHIVKSRYRSINGHFELQIGSLMLNPTSEVLVDGDTEVDHIELISSTCNRGVARSQIVVFECSKFDRGHFKFKFILGKYSYTILLLLQLLLLYTYIPLYPKCWFRPFRAYLTPPLINVTAINS